MKHVPVNSSDIRSIGYDEEKLLLEIAFHSGKTYPYPNVPVSEYNAFMAASSKGKYLHGVFLKRFQPDHSMIRKNEAL